jgi:hypothetical protein
MQMLARRFAIAVVAVAAVIAGMQAHAKSVTADGPEAQAASTVNAHVQIRSTFTPAPGGGRLKIIVKNLGPGTIQYARVDTGELLPSELRFAGPDAELTLFWFSDALAAGDTTGTVDGPYHPLPPLFVSQTLRVDSEQMLVTAESSGDVTLVRGINGTTTASHAASAPIYFMRPRVTATGGATGPNCPPGALWITCWVTTLPAGGKMTIIVDLQVDPATANGTKLKINLTMDGYPSGQITPIPGVIRLKVYNHNLVATRLWQYP